MVTYYKGKVGQSDIEFGTGTFTRVDKDGAPISKDQINKSHIPRRIITKTANYALSGLSKTNDIGEITFINTGAASTITFTLEPAIAGNGPLRFVVTEDGQQINVDPNGTEYFRDCAAGKYKYASVAGNRLIIWCDINGIWEWDYEGFWDNEV